MASIVHSLMVVLSSLLITGSNSFPSLRLLGMTGDNMKLQNHHPKSPLVATGQWEWKTAEEVSHESPPLPRRKRESFLTTTIETTLFQLLEDETTLPSMNLPTEPLEEDETHQPGLAGSRPSTEVTTMSTSLEDASTEAAMVHLSTRRNTVLLDSQMTTTSLSEDFTETESTKDGSHPSHTVDTTRPTSTAPSQTLAATSALSVVTVRPDSKSSVKRGGSPSSSFSPPVTSSRLSSTAQARPPPREASQRPDKMMGQCLLAISLLALVAAIFIITTFVLAALLLRQKRAYKLREHRHTEMVCISSLLAAEEVEASRERAHRPKRVKVLAENGSETDVDNLTLNSFLPDH